MHRNPFWIFFLSSLSLGILCYTFYTSWHWWQFIRLDASTSAEETQWAVVALDDEQFAAFTRYRFRANGKNYEGQIVWQETYLNPATAQEAVTRLLQAPIFVWFDASFPEISSLHKELPLKEMIYTALLWILWLYFLGLGYYVKFSRG